MKRPLIVGLIFVFAGLFSFYYWSVQRVLIFGDSTMSSIRSTGLPYRIINMARAGTTISQVREEISRFGDLDRFEAVVIAGGVNDLILSTGISIDEEYRNILATIPANVPVYLYGILPVSEPNRFGLKNADIMREDAKIAMVCRARLHCSMISGIPDRMPADLVKDGLHLTDSGATTLGRLSGL